MYNEKSKSLRIMRLNFLSYYVSCKSLHFEKDGNLIQFRKSLYSFILKLLKRT